jgi:hypothetical protein
MLFIVVNGMTLKNQNYLLRFEHACGGDTHYTTHTLHYTTLDFLVENANALLTVLTVLFRLCVCVQIVSERSLG